MNEPLNHTDYLILLALADAQRHGYGIIQEVEQRSGGRMRLGPGTLYGAIRRLLDQRLIEESPRRPKAASDDVRRRCYYRLTAAGRKTAASETERLAELVRVAESKRLIGRSRPTMEGG